MKIETLDDILEELANKIGIYGGCSSKNDDEDADCNNFEKRSYFCCRNVFTDTLDTRIRNAIENERKLNQVGI